MKIKFECLEGRWVRLYVDGNFMAEMPIIGFTFFLHGYLTCLERVNVEQVYHLSFEISRKLIDDFLQVLFEFTFSLPFEVNYVED